MKDASDEIIETVKILAPLTKNPNAPNEEKDTPIHNAAFYGHIEIIKILLLLIENTNPPDGEGETPIHVAAYKGHTEIVRIFDFLS